MSSLLGLGPSGEPEPQRGTLPAAPPGFWKTVRILLGAARKRSEGRRKRQQELLNQRAKKKQATNWGGLGFGFAALVMIGLNIAAAFAVLSAVKTGERIDAERHGKIVVSQEFLDIASTTEGQVPVVDGEPTMYTIEAHRITEHYGGSEAAIAQRLQAAMQRDGIRDFVSSDEVETGLSGVAGGPVTALLGSLMLFWWAAMLVAQGEGLELDLQRRRHPMWEWLFAHPLQPGAIFLAEMLTPIAANPIYWGGPLFVGIVVGMAQGPGAGFGAALLLGVPVTVALACLGKALEIAIILRFGPRSRGAMISLLSWFGYASMMAFFVGLMVLPQIFTAMSRLLVVVAHLPWPWLRLFVGGAADGSFSFVRCALVCVAGSGLVLAAAVGFSVWGAQQGLAGNFAAETGPKRAAGARAKFGREPLYRKELLWFMRDRSAIVQTILIPLTVAGYQVFNLRGILKHANGAWNNLCGAAVVFGTYFLWVLGPKSLTSEGQALWIALTWPRGLESLLKAKAWLWSMLSTGLVVLVLAFAVWEFPPAWWKVGLVGLGWFVFSRSMGEKSVTLVTVTSESGEVQKIPSGRRWAAMLGMLTFSIGVIGQQWHIAVMGIVYSWMTAAAMWQNFRARLPYLYDPWSEVLPDPPTLMHAMVAISILVEGGAVIAGIMVGFTGPGGLGVAEALGYAVCAVIVSVGTGSFLSNRGVTAMNVWTWREGRAGREHGRAWWTAVGLDNGWSAVAMLEGVGCGLLLGLFAMGYLAVLWHIPAAAGLLRKSQEEMASVPGLKLAYGIAAIGFAPFAEEYLFRGLLYRALDREWGGWRAVVGSAAFFAIYHGPLSWLPVGLLGAANAMLFKKTGKLAPCVVLHMVYNAVVLLH
jgi:membrane protease YdiL (CAAX protease family)